MKKIYVRPDVNVVKIATSPMMITGSGISNTDAETDALSRRRGGSFWDDKEEDYE